MSIALSKSSTFDQNAIARVPWPFHVNPCQVYAKVCGYGQRYSVSYKLCMPTYSWDHPSPIIALQLKYNQYTLRCYIVVKLANTHICVSWFYECDFWLSKL